MSKILELDITLRGSKPKIWRRVHVPADLTFHDLHYVIQFAMGWTNSHLHQFEVGRGQEYIRPPLEEDWDEPTDSRKTPISEHLAAIKEKITYSYDFGDSWEHEVVVKKVLETDPKKHYPLLVAGERACPPEDCGGIWGYAEILETLKKPGSDNYEDWIEWLGEDFDPAEFNLEEINDEYFKNFKQEMAEWQNLAGG